jgi:hypothetical protein
MIPTITIDMNAKCAECGKPGAVPSGICMGCTAKAFREKLLKSEIGRAVQARIRASGSLSGKQK